MPQVKVYGRNYTANIDVANREKEWLTQLAQDIQFNSKYENNILINLTWFGPEEDMLLDLIKSQNINNTQIWLSASIDGINWMYNLNFVNKIREYGFNHKFIGFGPDHWNSWMPKWIYENNKSAYVKLSENFKHYFLCYNRKPKLHRLELIEKIIANDLHNKGWITFDKGHFDLIDNLTNNTDQNLHTDDLRYSRPEDMATLGNLDVWNNSFCIIVTETEYNDPWQLTEKTWKPIMGLRPFIIVGHKNLENILANLEIYNPSELFNYNFNGIDSVIDFLKSLCQKDKTELYQLYQSLLPKLEHNKQKLIELAHKTTIL